MSDTEKRTPVKRGENFVYYSDGSLLLKNVRASYPNVFKARESEAEDGTKTSAYSITGLMPKDTHRDAKNMCVEIINKMLAENKIKAVAADRKFIKDGDTLAKDECEGQWVVSARETKNRPSVRSNKKDPETGKAKRLDPERDSNVIYGGCYVNILIRPWFQNNKFGKRVNASLVAVQFLRDGEAFGSGRIREEDVDDTFEAEEDDTGGWDDDTEGL